MKQVVLGVLGVGAVGALTTVPVFVLWWPRGLRETIRDTKRPPPAEAKGR
jgi:hypothetical protein